MGASPGAAVALTNMNAQIDVRPILGSIQVPTLVLHRIGDRCLRIEEGRYLAKQIPGVKLVELDGIDHLPFVGDQDAILDEIQEFLTGMRHARRADSVLATILHISVEGISSLSPDTNKASDLSRFRAFAEREIALFRGQHIHIRQNKLTVTFDGPARAVRAGIAIRNLAVRLGVAVRTGVHTGTCEIVEGRAEGPEVDLAERISDVAAIGQILISDPVRNLVVGSGLELIEYSHPGLNLLPTNGVSIRIHEAIS
jgi:hypothetical protein